MKCFFNKSNITTVVGPASILAKEIEKLRGPTQQGTKRKGDTLMFLKEKEQKIEDFPPFSPSDYSYIFPTFEPNDDYLPLLGRSAQIEKVRDTLRNLTEAPKNEPIVIITSRGMGKTFFMKRLVRGETPDSQPIATIQAAYQVGRIVCMECSQILAVFGINLEYYQSFWQVIIVFHLLQLFKDRRVDGINFQALNLKSIVYILAYKLEAVPMHDSLGKWIKRVLCMPVRDACIEMIRITKIAFNSNSDEKPVFLLDNIHFLAKLKTEIPSKTKNLHLTVLCQLINQLMDFRPPCILAGTTDGQLQLMAEIFKPVYIHLESLKMDKCYLLFKEVVKHLNFFYELDTPISCPDEDDPVFVAMTYESCQIPRLLKIAYHTWHSGKWKQSTDGFIMEDFYTQCREYYQDAISFITTLSVEDCSKLILFCSVNCKLYDILPSTKVEIKLLIEESIIFPYLDNSYVIPAFFWIGLETSIKKLNLKNPDAVLSHWKEVQNQISHLVPGIHLEDLVIYSKKWWTNAISIYDLGTLWEKLIASSLAVKYRLLMQTEQFLDLSQIYYLSTEAQAYSMLSKFSVNFSNGVITPLNEVSVDQNLNFAVYLNTHNAHHDIILSAKPENIAVQCKNSLIDPDGSTISRQLEGCKYLLWFYPGFDEEQDPPKQYCTPNIKNAIKEKRLGFLSGAGCASLLAVDMVIKLKEIIVRMKRE